MSTPRRFCGASYNSPSCSSCSFYTTTPNNNNDHDKGKMLIDPLPRTALPTSYEPHTHNKIIFLPPFLFPPSIQVKAVVHSSPQHPLPPHHLRRTTTTTPTRRNVAPPPTSSTKNSHAMILDKKLHTTPKTPHHFFFLPTLE